MHGPIDDLLGLLDLEPLEVNIYRGKNRDLGASRVYGGQVFAQALVAARRTVDGEREAHSAHGYFILPGDLQAPIVYFVDRLRDGSSFTTRRVTAIQHGQAIFNLSASFHIEEPGVAHQPTMPDVASPEELQPELDAIREVADRIPEEHRAAIVQERPIDFRPVLPLDFFAPEPREPVRHVWFKAIGSLPRRPVDASGGIVLRIRLRVAHDGLATTRHRVSCAGIATGFAGSLGLDASRLSCRRVVAVFGGQPHRHGRACFRARTDFRAQWRVGGVRVAGGTGTYAKAPLAIARHPGL